MAIDLYEGIRHPVWQTGVNDIARCRAWRLVLSMKPWSYIWLEFGLFSTIIAIIRACACWALFVVTLTNTVHLIYIYIYIYIYKYIYTLSIYSITNQMEKYMFLCTHYIVMLCTGTYMHICICTVYTFAIIFMYQWVSKLNTYKIFIFSIFVLYWYDRGCLDTNWT